MTPKSADNEVNSASSPRRSTSAADDVSDKKQIGLTRAGSEALAELMGAGLFASETDAYRVGISYALAKGMDPSGAPEGGYQTKFNAAGGLDVYSEIRDLVTILRPQDADRPYTTAERLAELGITALATRVAEHESFAEILSEFAEDEELSAPDVVVLGENATVAEPAADGSDGPAFEIVPSEQAAPYENCIPLVSLEAAAGELGSEARLVEPESWVSPLGRTRPGPGLFVAQVVGESMSRRIPNGAYCIFRFPVEGSRQGRVVLVEHQAIHDTELGGSFTLKLWESEKEESADGDWRHTEVRLKPDSLKSGFEPIVLRGVEESTIRVVAELHEVLPTAR